MVHQSNIHHGPQHNNKESLVLVNHFSKIHYKIRSNGFIRIGLQGLRRQKQGLDIKLQDLCCQD